MFEALTNDHPAARFHYARTYAKAKRAEIVILHAVLVYTEAIEKLLGFRSSQFRQVVMLPQGEFRKLLTADSKDRQVILETLFKKEFFN